MKLRKSSKTYRLWSSPHYLILCYTFATYAVIHNDIFLVQKLLNHKDINQTRRYAKVQEDKKTVAVEKMF